MPPWHLLSNLEIRLSPVMILEELLVAMAVVSMRQLVDSAIVLLLRDILTRPVIIVALLVIQRALVTHFTDIHMIIVCIAPICLLHLQRMF